MQSSSFSSSFKSLLSIFKGRASDFKDGENSIERCEASVQEHADITACRLVVKMICRHGKVYDLAQINRYLDCN